MTARRKERPMQMLHEHEEVPPAAPAIDRGDTLTIVRVFHAPRKLVYASWVEADRLAAWFAPDGYEVTSSELDARPGGHWRVRFRSPSGVMHREEGELRELMKPERLVFTLTQAEEGGHRGSQTLVTVSFAERDGRTELRFRQTGFSTAATRDGHRSGWKHCFDKLEAHLAER